MLNFSPTGAVFVFGCGAAALYYLMLNFLPIGAVFVFGCGAAALGNLITISVNSYSKQCLSHMRLD